MIKHLTLLHSNDMHGDFLPEKTDDTLVGGVSMLSGYVSAVRQQEPNCLYCVAGDMFTGSVIDSDYKGVSTIELMNMIAPDIVTVGNHDIDYGVSHFLFLEKCAGFPIINANFRVKTTRNHLFKPCRILEVDGMKILFIGILTEQALDQTRKDALVSEMVEICDPVEEVERICNAKKAIDVDLTVLLTHIGFEEDKKLAAALPPELGVDIIIGGHSHTLPEQPEFINGILVVQAGVGTNQIGRFDLEIDTDTNSVNSWKWKTVAITPENCPRDLSLEKALTTYKTETENRYHKVVTRFAREYTHPARNRETILGDIFSDALKESLGLDVMLLGSGSIRSSSLGPVVLRSDLMECFPFADPVYLVKMTGAQIKQVVLHMLRDDALDGMHTEFYQLSRGFEIIYSRASHSFEKFNFRGVPLDNGTVLNVGIQKYHWLNISANLNMDPAEIISNGKPRIISMADNQAIEEFMQSYGYFRKGPDMGTRLIIKQ